jgi:hypothetical protein
MRWSGRNLTGIEKARRWTFSTGLGLHEGNQKGGEQKWEFSRLTVFLKEVITRLYAGQRFIRRG